MSNAIAVDSAGNRYITGHYSLTADFDLSPAIATHTSSGSVDSIIAKYDANGNYLWARSAGGVLEETASSIVMNNNDEMIITGAFSLNTDFDLSNDSFNLTSINSSDMFLAKYKDCSPTPVVVTLSGNTLITTTSADSYQWIDCSNNNTPISGATNASFTPAVSGNYAAVININGCRSISACQTVLSVNSALANTVKLYPNPSSGIFRIILPAAYQKTEIQTTDLTGKIIRKWDFKGIQECEIRLEEEAKGIYFIQLQCDDETATFKVIKN